jgi:hypothetical protein
VCCKQSPHIATNGRTVQFRGSVPALSIPDDGVLVLLEARYPGAPWKQFRAVRSTARGAFKASYKFVAT